MPNPDAQFQNRDLAADIIDGRVINSTGFAIPDALIHAGSLRTSTSTGALAPGVSASLLSRRKLSLYPGDTSADGPALVAVAIFGTFSTSTGFSENRQLGLALEAPPTADPSGVGAMSLALKSNAVDDSVAPEARFFYNGGSTNTPRANFSGVSVTADMVFATTDAGVANVVVTSTGGLHRNASALKYKPGWQFAPDLADRTLPRPIVWETNQGLQLGYGAEHVAVSVPEAAAHEQYHLAGIVAVLQDKVERLEGRAGI